MPQLDTSVFFLQSINFTNYFIIIFSFFFIATPIIMGLIKTRNHLSSYFSSH